MMGNIANSTLGVPPLLTRRACGHTFLTSHVPAKRARSATK